MTPLAATLVRQIRATGPINVAEYMTACLLHPRHGYYTTRQPLGGAGDFVTAPEISQMFGELVGLALAQAWLDRGRPDPVALVEFGPGRGTLMADALRATRAVPGFHAALRLHLVEVPGPLRRVQAEALRAHDPVWLAGVTDLPPLPTLAIANEFLDALPIRQFLRDGAGWRERLVAVRDDALTFALSDRAPLGSLPARFAETRDGDLVEIGAPATAFAEELGAHLTRQGGAALLIDYGGDGPGDTLQAVRGHRKESPLDRPGAADLTAHVDFRAIADAAPCTVAGPVPQGVWLERLGIAARARALARGLSGAALETHVAAHRRLTHPCEMGDLFRVLALHDGAGPPPGLA
ncbi:ATP synthase beta subunit/transcription termination factor rho [Oceaniovalibus guishaninsula JLT2003]|uniref:ATP synthase beta subunit/transcription termination factor rho n=1 Tax=Oceaniovalibus guishaninsula JLT2003 TaxID=1231392 RepID=K2HLW6_9RHOB|nr:SAM-dependent methyltransferase [Oceaniovalibus guishaninsula]EKE43884.1 ATP synthase beta subunit/transcription termination factor rho [Oceaniovalibus guishaninsula JLT2003]